MKLGSTSTNVVLGDVVFIHRFKYCIIMLFSLNSLFIVLLFELQTLVYVLKKTTL